MPTETAAAPRPRPALPHGSRVRAFRAEEADDTVKRRMEALRAGAPHATEIARAQIARALRLARKAARSRQSGPGDYDPARHAALLRLARGARAGTDARIR